MHSDVSMRQLFVFLTKGSALCNLHFLGLLTHLRLGVLGLETVMDQEIWVLGKKNLLTEVVKQLVTGKRTWHQIDADDKVKPERIGLETYEYEGRGLSDPPRSGIRGVRNAVFIGCEPDEEWRGQWEVIPNAHQALIKLGKKDVRYCSSTYSDATLRWVEIVDAFMEGGELASKMIGASKEEIENLKDLDDGLS